jgi:hypothetical protein
MQESHREEVAHHTDPEPCASRRKATGEALTGAHAHREPSRPCPKIPILSVRDAFVGLTLALCRPMRGVNSFPKYFTGSGLHFTLIWTTAAHTASIWSITNSQAALGSSCLQ